MTQLFSPLASRLSSRFSKRIPFTLPLENEDGSPVVVYIRPLTVADEKGLGGAFLAGKDHYPELVIKVTYLTADGPEKAFDATDVHVLASSVPEYILTKIVDTAYTAVSYEEAEKNFGKM